MTEELRERECETYRESIGDTNSRNMYQFQSYGFVISVFRKSQLLFKSSSFSRCINIA